MMCSEPTRATSPFCSARSTLACAVKSMSPISSKNSVPPWACSKKPRLRACAPVNEPFARAALPGDEHAGFGRSDLVDVLEQLLDRRTGADHLVARFEFDAQLLDGAVQARGADRIAHTDQHALAVQRL